MRDILKTTEQKNTIVTLSQIAKDCTPILNDVYTVRHAWVLCIPRVKTYQMYHVFPSARKLLYTNILYILQITNNKHVGDIQRAGFRP